MASKTRAWLGDTAVFAAALLVGGLFLYGAAQAIGWVFLRSGAISLH